MDTNFKIKAAVLFAATFFILFNASGQANRRDVFSLFPAIGLNGCQIHGDSYSGYDKLGMMTGVAINARLSEKTNLQLGFYFSQKGSRHNPNQKTGDYSYYRLNLNYIDLPLALRYNLNDRYFLSLGPSLAYLITYNENVNYTDVTGFYHFRRFETALHIGIGRWIGSKWLVEFRSSNSIVPIRDYGLASNVYYTNFVARYFNKGLYNNILTLFVAYHMDLRKKTNER